MLEQNGFESLANLSSFFLNSEKGENVSILSDDIMGLKRIFVVGTVFFELEFGFGMDSS